jgi:hypothetical protein
LGEKNFFAGTPLKGLRFRSSMVPSSLFGLRFFIAGLFLAKYFFAASASGFFFSTFWPGIKEDLPFGFGELLSEFIFLLTIQI